MDFLFLTFSINYLIVFLINNDLSGTIPSRMFQMPLLEQLILANNRLKGSISENIDNIELSLSKF